MPHLTSAQEAAFNAAGEALADLQKDGDRITLSILPSDGRFFVFGEGADNNTLFSDYHATLGEAVQGFFVKLAEQRDAPPKIETAKDAIAAAKTAISDLANENNSKFIDSDLLAERLEEIAVA